VSFRIRHRRFGTQNHRDVGGLKPAITEPAKVPPHHRQTRQSAPVSRETGTAIGLSKFSTFEMNSLTFIPKCPHNRRFKLV